MGYVLVQLMPLGDNSLIFWMIMKKTILLGKCMYQLHKNNPDIQEMIAIKGCPPKAADIIKALHQAGIEANPALFENIDQLPGFFMSRYADKPEFDESFFRID